MTSHPPLNKEKHVKYWQRCHSSYLPTPYTSSDSTRLMWACFILSAKDLLSVALTPDERVEVRTWVLSLQHPEGGFCGSATHSLPGTHANKGHANLAATFFALVTLALAAEGGAEARSAFNGVKRGPLLRWLKSLQRNDGSFGQNLWDGKVVGGRDTRHSYLASSIRWILRGAVKEGDAGWEEDIDVNAMISNIRQGQTYDGGIAEVSRHESHAGYAYCAVAALALLDRVPSSITLSHTALEQGIQDRKALLKFLAGRQFTYLAQKEEEEDENEEGNHENLLEAQLGSLSLEESCQHLGYNGRWNKKADTCYCWWVASTMAMLGEQSMVNVLPSRRYLLQITQHQIGGFGKTGGAPPDIYHAYLGLAALAMMGDNDLKSFDVGLCCTEETTAKIAMARDGLLEFTRRTTAGTWKDDGFW